MRTHFVIAFLLGVIAALLGVLVFGHPAAPAEAQTVSGGGGFVMGTANYFENGGRNMLWLLRTGEGAAHLCLYEAREGQMKLSFSRNITYDFMPDQFPATEASQLPSVQDMFTLTKKKREEERKAPPGGGGAGGDKAGDKPGDKPK